MTISLDIIYDSEIEKQKFNQSVSLNPKLVGMINPLYILLFIPRFINISYLLTQQLRDLA